jgi:hypothetical protein
VAQHQRCINIHGQNAVSVASFPFSSHSEYPPVSSLGIFCKAQFSGSNTSWRRSPQSLLRVSGPTMPKGLATNSSEICIITRRYKVHQEGVDLHGVEDYVAMGPLP